MERLFGSIKEADDWFKSKFGEKETFDAEARELHLWDMPALLMYINGLTDGNVLTGLLTEMQWNQVDRTNEMEESKKFLSYFPYHSVTAVKE